MHKRAFNPATSRTSQYYRNLYLKSTGVKMEKKIKTIQSFGTKYFFVSFDEVKKENGSFTKRVFLNHPQASAIIPFISDDRIIMVRQYRYALKRETLEIPAGKIDIGESPEQCIKREMIEETGFDAGSIEWIYTYAPAVGYSNELIHIYKGKNLNKLDTKIDKNEISSVEVIEIKEAVEMIKNHEIYDSKTIIAMALTFPLV
jgi:ADP-ribose pyrophosphatase